MSIFKTLAETIYEKTFFNIEEMESVIETYFKLFLSDLKANELISDSVQRERMRIVSEKNQLGIKRTAIEKQLFDAKSKIAEGKGSEVDRYWFSRANMAFRLTKQSIVRCQEALTELSYVQKQKNIQKSNNEDRITKDELLRILEERFGAEYVSELKSIVYENARLIIQNNETE